MLLKNRPECWPVDFNMVTTFLHTLAPSVVIFPKLVEEVHKLRTASIYLSFPFLQFDGPLNFYLFIEMKSTLKESRGRIFSAVSS